MSLSRRKSIALIGGGVVLAATAGAAIAVARKPRAALAPWSLAGGYEDPRMRALSYAVLAPNPHNRQPWLVDLSKPDEVTLYADKDRLLPHTDPFSRQIVIGLGCFLELMRMAAAEEKIGVQFDLFPDGADRTTLDQRRVATCRFAPGMATPDPLFAQVFKRRSLKEPYDTARPVSNEALAALRQIAQNGPVAGSTNAPEKVSDLRLLTFDALKTELLTPHTYKESVDLFRICAAEVDANPDGIDFSGAQWEALHLSGLFTRASVLDHNGMAFQGGLDMIEGNAMTAMAYVWLTTKGNARAEQIAAGRDWLRVNMAVAEAGLGVQPMSQPLQEYPEMADLYTRLHLMLAPEGGTVQMLGRLGYGPQVPHSPRWRIEDKIRRG